MKPVNPRKSKAPGGGRDSVGPSQASLLASPQIPLDGIEEMEISGAHPASFHHRLGSSDEQKGTHSSPSSTEVNNGGMPMAPPPLPFHVQHRIHSSGSLAPQTPATFLNLSTRPNLNTTSSASAPDPLVMGGSVVLDSSPLGFELDGPSTLPPSASGKLKGPKKKSSVGKGLADVAVVKSPLLVPSKGKEKGPKGLSPYFSDFNQV